MDKIKKILGEQPLAPPDLKEVEKQAGVPRNRLGEVIRLLEREGAVVRITADMYFLASSIVITSYSIHYTKLYEAISSRRPEYWGLIPRPSTAI